MDAGGGYSSKLSACIELRALARAIRTTVVAVAAMASIVTVVVNHRSRSELFQVLEGFRLGPTRPTCEQLASCCVILGCETLIILSITLCIEAPKGAIRSTHAALLYRALKAFLLVGVAVSLESERRGRPS